MNLTNSEENHIAWSTLPREACKTLEQELLADLAIWQKVLSLSSWEIAIRVLRKYEMPAGHEDSAACVDFKMSSERALIRVLRPEDIGPETFESEPRKSLLHELMHLVISKMLTGEEKLPMWVEENVVKNLTNALWAARDYYFGAVKNQTEHLRKEIADRDHALQEYVTAFYPDSVPPAKAREAVSELRMRCEKAENQLMRLKAARKRAKSAAKGRR